MLAKSENVIVLPDSVLSQQTLYQRNVPSVTVPEKIIAWHICYKISNL